MTSVYSSEKNSRYSTPEPEESSCSNKSCPVDDDADDENDSKPLFVINSTEMKKKMKEMSLIHSKYNMQITKE